MDALLMCGGEGTRLEADCEKPLFEIDDQPMVDAVLGALDASRIETITAVVSPATPSTRTHLETEWTHGAISILDAPGDGYVADLQYALEDVESPVLTVAADLPLLEPKLVEAVLESFEGTKTGDSLTVCVPAALKRALGVSVETTCDGEDSLLAPTGLNVVGEGDAEETLVSWDGRLAVNVNRRTDAEVVEALR